eukprot:5873289-Amphidinium_carterae.1
MEVQAFVRALNPYFWKMHSIKWCQEQISAKDKKHPNSEFTPRQACTSLDKIIYILGRGPNVPGRKEQECPWRLQN